MKPSAVVAKPDLTSLLNLLKTEILLAMNCHALGTIQSFDSVKQTVQVSINYTKTYFDQGSTEDPKFVSYPLLIDCPVVILTGGTASLTFPITQGDTCLILFNDRDIDTWATTGATGAPVASARLHSISDAIALVGVRSLQGVLASYDTTRAVLQNGPTYVGVSLTKVKVANAGTTLNTLLQTLMTDLTTLNTTLNTVFTAMSAATPANVVATVGVPSATAAAALAAFAATLSTLSTQIGGLLE